MSAPQTPVLGAVAALVAALAVLAPATVQARTFDAVAAAQPEVLAVAAADDVPNMVTETDPKYKIPKDFLLGAATGSYQTEGAWDKDGKGESVFDYFYHHENYTTNRTGDVACNSYERYEDDIRLAAEMNLDVYRFSIAWARIFPNGDTSVKNQKGIDHYHNVIKTIKRYNMKPMITLYHFDHPQALETKFNGWLSDQMIQTFVDYADFIFSEYGSEVRHWVTLNEPNMHCAMVYSGALAPGRPNAGYTGNDIYNCLHREILAHAATYRMYQQKYKQKQDGLLGFGPVTFFSRPNSSEWDDIIAAERANMFDIGFLVNPLIYGDYSQVVKDTLRRTGKETLLPTFTDEQKEQLKGAIDFVTLNAYFGQIVADPAKGSSGQKKPTLPGPRADCDVAVVAIGDPTVTSGQPGFGNVFAANNAWVLRDTALWIKAHFGTKVGVFFTENGMGALDETAGSLDDWDTRATYHSAYLRELMRTVNEDDVNVLGYTMWSFMDDFEWSATYVRRFGLVAVDFENGTLDRTPKRSHYFFKRMMQDRAVPLVEKSAPTPAPATAAGVVNRAATPAVAAVCAVLVSTLSLL